MRVKLFFCILMLTLVFTGCAGVQATGGDSVGSKGLTKGQLKNMGVSETQGGY